MATSEWVAVKLEVRNRAQFIADMKASGTAVRTFGNEVGRTGGLMRTGSHHGFLWNQMLFTARRTVYGLTLGLAALSGAVVVLGFQYNSMIEQQTLAFTKFTGSAQAANDEIKFLFDLAAHGPFDFPGIIAGARQLQAFGLSVGDTESLLTDLQDAMAAMGLDASQIQRATLALGQIQSSGRLLGQDLRQLEQLGLVSPQDLARRLGFQPADIGRVGQLNISSKRAIDALTAYWRERFGGAAKDFQNTWTGLLSTLHDYAQKLFGSMVFPLQHYLERHTLPTVIALIQLMQTGWDKGGFWGALGAVDESKGTHLVHLFKQLVSFGKNVITIVRGVASSFWTAWKSMHATFLILAPLVAFVYLLAHSMGVLKPILVLLFIWFIANRTAMLAVWSASKLVALGELLLASRIGWVTKLLKVQTLWQTRSAVASLLSGKMILKAAAALKAWAFAETLATPGSGRIYTGMKANNGIIAKLTRTIFTRFIPAMTAMTAAEAAVGISATAMWAAIALPVVILLGLGLLYWKWKAFHDLVDRTFRWIRANWRTSLLIVAPLFGPLTVAIALVVKLWDKVRGLYGWLKRNNPVHKVTSGGFWGNVGKWAGAGASLGLTTLIPGMMPHMATGGHTLTAGMAMVGEAGPEVLSLPRGATVSPLNTGLAHLGRLQQGQRSGKIEINVPLYMDRKQIALATATYNLDDMANQ